MTASKMPQVMLLCVGLSIGCAEEPRIIKAPILEQESREQLGDRKPDKSTVAKVLTDEELETMASHKPREGMGMNFYYDELRKRSDAEWAKQELERRKASR